MNHCHIVHAYGSIYTMCAYFCIYRHICIIIHMFIYLFVCTSTCTYDIYLYRYTYLCMCVYVYIYMDIHIYVYYIYIYHIHRCTSHSVPFPASATCPKMRAKSYQWEPTRQMFGPAVSNTTQRLGSSSAGEAKISLSSNGYSATLAWYIW